MKIRVEKKVLISILSVYVFVFLVLTLAFVFGEGCPPNETCPDGWEPVAVGCLSHNCDEVAQSGYCIMCRKSKMI
jgi:hypothetical protein